jgi:hypothetical protein
MCSKTLEVLGLYKLSHSNLQIQPFITKVPKKLRKNNQKIEYLKYYKIKLFDLFCHLDHKNIFPIFGIESG